MSTRREQRTSADRLWIHSTRLHVVLYSLLLVATPFVMLQNFLQDAIARLSRFSVEIGGRDVPVVPAVAALVAVIVLALVRRHVTLFRILAGLVGVAMIALAQQIADYYFGHKFYDLQQNWHYLAYGVFAFMMYRDLAPRGWSAAGIGAVTWIAALLFSTFDEAFQLHMSSRVFDIGDIAKDVWGALIGVTVLYLGTRDAAELREDFAAFRRARLADYFRQPLSLLVLLGGLSLLFLAFSSLLTQRRFTPVVVLLTICGFIAFFIVYHLCHLRRGRRVVLVLAAVAIVVQAGFFHKHRDDGIVYRRDGLTVYKGIPIPFFDVLFFPDGGFRPVDKKEYFNTRDQRFFLRHEPDILLIGAGESGRGGRGFPKPTASQFVYNPRTRRGVQVIILRSSEACRLFNRLKREDKRVLFVLHSAG